MLSAECIHLFQGSGKWYELQDLHVADILPQMITLSESYIQVLLLLQSCMFTLLDDKIWGFSF